MAEEQAREPKGHLVIDGGGAEVPPDILEIVGQLGEALGMAVVQGQISTCDGCGFFECVCQVRKDHKEGCRFLQASQCPVSIPCSHGEDVCHVCDKCDCKP